MATVLKNEFKPEQRPSLVKRVETLLPQFKALADQADEQRFAPQEAIDLLKEAGFFRYLVPARYGGEEGDLRDWLHAARTLAHADMSIAWVASLLGIHVLGLTTYDERMQEEFWSDTPDTLIATSVAPAGRATEVEGGVILSGRFRWSSGCDHADWAMVGFLGQNADGQPTPYLAGVPRADFTIEDTWFTSGLRGTGSKDLVVTEKFVPSHRIQSVGPDAVSKCPGLHDNGLYQLPFITVFPILFPPVILGAVEGALEVFLAEQSKRIRSFSGEKATDSKSFVMRIAETKIELRAALAMLEKHWDSLLGYAERNEPVPPQQILEWTSEDSWVGRVATRSVERLMEIAGSSAHFSENKFQRFWRDIHTAGSHVYLDTDAGFLALGGSMISELNTSKG